MASRAGPLIAVLAALILVPAPGSGLASGVKPTAELIVTWTGSGHAKETANEAPDLLPAYTAVNVTRWEYQWRLTLQALEQGSFPAPRRKVAKGTYTLDHGEDATTRMRLGRCTAGLGPVRPFPTRLTPTVTRKGGVLTIHFISPMYYGGVGGVRAISHSGFLDDSACMGPGLGFGFVVKETTEETLRFERRQDGIDVRVDTASPVTSKSDSAKTSQVDKGHNGHVTSAWKGHLTIRER